MSRKARLSVVRRNQAIARTENGHLKRDERTRRDERMKGLLRKGTFPYTPSIQSWLSVHLGKPTCVITQEDVNELLK